MNLPPGSRIGPYEILSALGVGGMGEVYRARDAKLNRDVAIKVLLPSVVADPDRIARFRREAQVLASLNHPSIANIYGIEEADGVTALVLELVEGEDLAQRLTRGAIAIDEALPIAVQIAEALEAAHDLGIIHRDLKPANVKLRPDGTVKVLDFGLAKAIDLSGSTSAGAMNSPTLSMHATQAGVVLGTAAYMAPEQARGKVVDRRADIWAFGVVLYEMLTGQRPFKGGDVTDILASVLKDTPAFDALPASTPTRLRWVLERCLERNPKARLRDIGEARVQLAATAKGDLGSDLWKMGAAADATPVNMQAQLDTASAHARRRMLGRAVLPLVAVASIAVVFAVVGFSRPRTAPVAAPVARMLITPPALRILAGSVRGRVMALSRSGTELAYIGDNELFIRKLSDFEIRPIAATDLGRNLQSPVFSPDGEWIAFYAGSDRTVKRVSVHGGAALRVCQSLTLGLDWDDSGILLAQGNRILRCNLTGSGLEPLATVGDEETALSPQILPGGEHLLFTIAKSAQGTGTQARVVVESLRTHERKTILEEASQARFLKSGHLIYAVGGIVFAVPFDARKLEVRGVALPVVEGVRRGLGGAMQMAVSDAGTLVYVSGPTGPEQTLQSLAVADRTGAITRFKVPPGAYSDVRVSPDGLRAAIGIDDGTNANILVYVLSGTTAIKRLTHEGRSRFPVWSPDGEWIAFASSDPSGAGVFRQKSDGTGVAERLTTAATGEEHVPESWSRDGRSLSFAVSPVGSRRSALWMLSMPDKKTAHFGGVTSTEPTGSVFSPDGKWLAYAIGTNSPTTADVNRGIFIQPVPATGEKHQVPRQVVDFHPAWWKSELVFTAAATTGLMASIPVITAGAPSFGAPVQFPATVTGDRVSGVRRAWDIMPDGRLIGIVSDADNAARSATTELRLVVNWFEELKQRVPVQ